MDYSLAGSPSKGCSRPEHWSGSLLQGSSRLRDQTLVSDISCIGRQVVYHEHHLGSPWGGQRYSETRVAVNQSLLEMSKRWYIEVH